MARKSSSIPDKWKTKGCSNWRLSQPNSPHPSSVLQLLVTVDSNHCLETWPNLSWFCPLCFSFTTCHCLD